MAGAILYINNKYLYSWEEFKILIIHSFTSQSYRFKNVQQEILSSVRDGIAYDWAIQHNLIFSKELDSDNFIGMTDGELQKLPLNLCGAQTYNVNLPTFNNHLEIVNEYKIIEGDVQKNYPISTPIPLSKSRNREFQIGVRVVNPINDRISVTLIKHDKKKVAHKIKLNGVVCSDINIDLKVKGFIHYITIDVANLKSNESISLYSTGKLVHTFNSLPEFVDLGFGTKWGTCNLGAEHPNDSGDFFAWGESKTRKCFNDNQNYCHQSNISGIKPYDAATVIRGQNWRIPKRKEWNTLYSKCDVTHVELDGIPCLKFTSKVNHKHIILPIIGYMDGTEIVGRGSEDCYWSSIQDDRNYAFDNQGNWKYKYLGLLIRPIYDGIKQVLNESNI